MMKAPWLKFYNSVPHHLDYPDISIFELMEKAAEKYLTITMSFWHNSNVYAVCRRGASMCKSIEIPGN